MASLLATRPLKQARPSGTSGTQITSISLDWFIAKAKRFPVGLHSARCLEDVFTPASQKSASMLLRTVEGVASDALYCRRLSIVQNKQASGRCRQASFRKIAPVLNCISGVVFARWEYVRSWDRWLES